MFEAVNWPAVEAIGTVSAVVVALGLAGAQAWRGWWTKPKLAISVSGVEPHSVAIGSTTTIVAHVLLRAEVRNHGRRAAQHLAGRVTGHWIEDLPLAEADHLPGPRPYRMDGWRLRESEPAALKWASGTAVTIAPGQSEYLCLVSLRRNDLELSLCLLDPENSILKAVLGRDLARHRLRIVVTADDCKPIVGVVEFVIDGKSFISQVAMAEVPADARDTRLLTLLREMANSPDELAAAEEPDVPTIAAPGLRPMNSVESAPSHAAAGVAGSPLTAECDDDPAGPSNSTSS